MQTVLNAPAYAEVPQPRFQPGPAGTHITIRGLTKYFAGWPLYDNFDLDIPTVSYTHLTLPTIYSV